MIKLREKLNSFTPRDCRAVARKANGMKPMSIRDIAEASGLSKSTVAEISHLYSWDSLTLDVIVRFSEGCGVNLMDISKHLHFIRSHKMIHITVGNRAQRRYYNRLLTEQSQTTQSLRG